MSALTDVAKTKWNSGSEIEDPIREQQLLSEVAVKAQTVGVPTEWARRADLYELRLRSNLLGNLRVYLRLKAVWVGTSILLA
jgi:hypothetical protein